MNNTAIVIGAGIAGLAASIRLAAKGYWVQVFEASAKAGGKLDEFSVKGYRFDKGPSLFTMPWLVDELFELAGENPSEFFKYKKLDTACHYFWEDGTIFKAPSSADEFSRKAGEVFDQPVEPIARHLEHSQEIYDLTAGIFMEKSLHRLDTYTNKQVWKALKNVAKLDLLETMDSANRKRISNPKLVQLFNRYATYNGSSPYKAPGVLNIIPSLEHGSGTFFPEGGMHNITNALYKLALRKGVEFNFNRKVTRIVTDQEQAKGIEVNGTFHSADVVVSNMDIVPTYQKLLPDIKAPQRALQQERSSSALIFYWGINKSFDELALHNIFFSDHYRKEFEVLFDKKSIYKDPTVYVNITSKEWKEDAPEGKENWFVMVNAPHLNGQNWEKLIEQSRRNVLDKLSRMLHVNMEELIETEELLTPELIQKNTSSYLGSLYGSSSNDRMAAFFRHPNFHRKIKGLYFCGGSVHPGGGIPLCLLSAKIMSEQVR